MSRISLVIQSLAVTTILSACGGSTDVGGSSRNSGIGNLTPESAVVSANADGSLPDQGFSTTGTRGTVSQLSTNGTTGVTTGFQYQYGQVAGTNRFRGVAGFAPNSEVGATEPTTAASATYTGDYRLTHVSDRVDSQNGQITLNADFSNGTLQGNAGGLTVNGSIAGRDVGGTATYRGVTANMDGLIGADRTVAAFAGNTGSAVLVGGIDADRNP